MREFKVVGMMRVKDEIRWIQRVIDSMRSICSEVVVLDDHSTDGTFELLQSLSPFVTVVENPYHGLDEARDKDFLLRIVVGLSPDWVLAIDGDEELEPRAEAKIEHFLQRHGRDPEVAVFAFKVCYLWDSPEMVRVDGVYENFYRPSMFRITGQPVSRLHFNQTGGPGGHNLHCSNFPQGLKGGILNVAVRLKHYGYLAKEDRQRKFEYYNRVDPGNITEDGYKHIIGLRSRHAPGQMVFDIWED
jgi:glycosyltransferase involved in cell wall biosynthesis